MIKKFEAFIRSTRPATLIFFDKIDGVYESKNTALLYAAWTAGMAKSGFMTFRMLMEPTLTDWRIDLRDGRCFMNNKTQRHYWAYLTAKEIATGKMEAPFLKDILEEGENGTTV
jgi:hypothetical protein